MIKKENLRLGLLLIPMILGLACAVKKPLISSRYVIEVRPSSMPNIIDHSPHPCPECLKISDQKMFKITERDFLSIKEKIIELDDYNTYLLELLAE